MRAKTAARARPAEARGSEPVPASGHRFDYAGARAPTPLPESAARASRTKGKSVSDQEAIDRVMSGQSWQEFCDTLKSAGQTILADGQPDDVLDRAEGFRYLSRLTRAALETYIEFADPLAPVLNRPVHETAKIGADNPDNYYQHATLSGKPTSIGSPASRGTIHYIDFATQSGGVASSGDSRTGRPSRRRRSRNRQ